MIRVHSPEESLQYCEKIYGGYNFSFNSITCSGVTIDDYYKSIPKSLVQGLLDTINEFFPLHWADIDIFCVPFRPMILKDGQWTGSEYNGRAWSKVVVLGARRDDVVEREIASMLLHELWHVFAYQFIDADPFDRKDTPEYIKFKELMGIDNYTDKDIVWEDRPAEILAELGRWGSQLELFTWENFLPFDSPNDPKPSQKALDYLLSLMPEQKEGDEMSGILTVSEIDGVPCRVDLIPKSNTTSRPQYLMTPTSITIHNTGNSKADANANSEYVDNTTNYVSWHFTVDDKEIIQELPVNESAWHAGDGRNGDGNRTSIGIEICEQEGIDWETAKMNAIKLVKFLIDNIDTISGVNKVLPHKYWTGKYCPRIILNEGWDKFIQEVENYMSGKRQYAGKVVDRETKIVLNGEVLDVPAIVLEYEDIGGISFAPLRAIAEKLGLKVGYNGDVLLDTKNE